MRVHRPFPRVFPPEGRCARSFARTVLLFLLAGTTPPMPVLAQDDSALQDGLWIEERAPLMGVPYAAGFHPAAALELDLDPQSGRLEIVVHGADAPLVLSLRPTASEGSLPTPLGPGRFIDPHCDATSPGPEVPQTFGLLCSEAGCASMPLFSEPPLMECEAGAIRIDELSGEADTLRVALEFEYRSPGDRYQIRGRLRWNASRESLAIPCDLGQGCWTALAPLVDVTGDPLSAIEGSAVLEGLVGFEGATRLPDPPACTRTVCLQLVELDAPFETEPNLPLAIPGNVFLLITIFNPDEPVDADEGLAKVVPPPRDPARSGPSRRRPQSIAAPDRGLEASFAPTPSELAPGTSRRLFVPRPPMPPGQDGSDLPFPLASAVARALHGLDEPATHATPSDMEALADGSESAMPVRPDRQLTIDEGLPDEPRPDGDVWEGRQTFAPARAAMPPSQTISFEGASPPPATRSRTDAPALLEHHIASTFRDLLDWIDQAAREWRAWSSTRSGEAR